MDEKKFEGFDFNEEGVNKEVEPIADVDTTDELNEDDAKGELTDEEDATDGDF